MRKIKFVKKHTKNDVEYSWFVRFEENVAREYVNFEDGKTVAERYPLEALPKYIQKFVATHKEELFTEQEYDGEVFATYIIK